MSGTLIIVPRSREKSPLPGESINSYPSPLLVDRINVLRPYYEEIVLVAGHHGITTVHSGANYRYYKISMAGGKFQSKIRYARRLYRIISNANSPTVLNFDPNLTGAAIGLLAKAAGGRLVTKFIGLPEQDPGWLRKSRLGFTLLLAISDVAITISPYCKQRLQQLYHRDIRVVTNRVHPDFQPMDVDSIPHSVLYVGRFDPEKRVMLLLEAFAQLVVEQRNATLLLVGDVAEKYRERAYSLNIAEKTEFIGRVPRREIPKWMNRATVFAYPTQEEAFGMALIESMACGTPVVGADSGSIPWVIDSGGIVFDPTNSEEFTSALERMLFDQAYRDEFADQARSRAADFPHETWGEDLYQAIQYG